MDQPKKRKSPYQRYGKSPFRYSAEHGAWLSAVRSGKGIATAAEAHSRKFAPWCLTREWRAGIAAGAVRRDANGFPV